GVRLGALSPTDEWRLAATLSAPAAPQTAMGCSMIERMAGGREEAPASQTEADDKEGGYGTRAKGDEGSMGKPSGGAQRYGVKGPADSDHSEPMATAAPAAPAAEPAP